MIPGLQGNGYEQWKSRYGMVNVKDYPGNDTDSIAAAVRDVGDRGVLVIPPGTYNVDSMPTIPGTVDLIDSGAKIVLNGVVQYRGNYYLKQGQDIDVQRDFLASGSNRSTTGSITAGTNTLTLTSAEDFQDGQGVAVMHAGPGPYQVGTTTPLSSPATPTISNVGTTGTTTYTYYVAALDNLGGVTAASPAGTTTTGNTALNTTNYNTVSWTAVTGAWAYAIWGDSSNPSTSQGFLAIVTGTSYNDQGNGNGVNGGNQYVASPPWVPVSPPASSLGEYLLTTIQSGGSTTSLILTDKASNTVSGVYISHDDTPSFTAALSTAENAVKTVRIPRNSSGFPVWGQFTIPANVRLVGMDNKPQVDVEPGYWSPEGCTLSVRGTSSSPITFQTALSAEVSGIVLYYPDQIDTNPPIAYPASIALPANGAYDLTVRNIYVVNAYDFLNAQNAHGRLHVQNVTGCAKHRGILIDGSYDVDRVENIHFINVWPPLSSAANNPSVAYTKDNGESLLLGRADGIQVSNFFSYGYSYGMHLFSGSVSGVSGETYGSFYNISFDGVGQASMFVEALSGNGLSMSNVSFIEGLYGIHLNDTAQSSLNGISISNLRTWNINTPILHQGNGVGMEIINYYIGWNVSIGNQALAVANSTGNNRVVFSNGEFVNYNSGSATAYDVANNMSGSGVSTIEFSNTKFTSGNSWPTVYDGGGGQFKVISEGGSSRGALIAPSIPASGNSVTNDFYRSVRVYISGGTVSDISINGTSTGLTSGEFFLKPYDQIGITYTASPSWVWVGL